jgi:hypothetical protein
MSQNFSPIFPDKSLYDIAQHGTFYRPATSHYFHPQGWAVRCNNCGKKNLSVCVGYDNIDLCLPCVDKIIDHHNKSIVIMYWN